jgi:hypothetical protein
MAVKQICYYDNIKKTKPVKEEGMTWKKLIHAAWWFIEETFTRVI